MWKLTFRKGVLEHDIPCVLPSALIFRHNLAKQKYTKRWRGKRRVFLNWKFFTVKPFPESNITHF
jgi:hypothetical protein